MAEAGGSRLSGYGPVALPRLFPVLLSGPGPRFRFRLVRAAPAPLSSAHAGAAAAGTGNAPGIPRAPPAGGNGASRRAPRGAARLRLLPW